MWLRSRTPRGRRGFTVLEALVSVIILVVVMTAAGSLLFSMKSFAQKQQSFAAPRQTSRAGLDYLTYYFEGAGDLNTAPTLTGSLGNPNALLMYYKKSESAAETQASFNNLTAAQAALGLGDVGTDAVTLEVPVSPMRIPIENWPGFHAAATMWVGFTEGCSVSDDYNMYLFQQATGATPLTNPVSNSAQSAILTVWDANGAWAYYQITSYQTSDCSKAPYAIHVVANPGKSNMLNPPGGYKGIFADPVHISAGIQFISFRVRNGNLEQKNGMYDPATDNPGTAFFPVVENVEDFQVAYIYGQGAQNGQIWNTASQSLATAGVANGIPTQAGPNAAPGVYDIQNVIGVRISVTGRSMPLPLSGRKLASLRAQSTDPTLNFYYRPASEDHPKGALDYVPGPNPMVYHHQRYTTTLMVRNRALGG